MICCVLRVERWECKGCNANSWIEWLITSGWCYSIDLSVEWGVWSDYVHPNRNIPTIYSSTLNSLNKWVYCLLFVLELVVMSIHMDVTKCSNNCVPPVGCLVPLLSLLASLASSCMMSSLCSTGIIGTFMILQAVGNHLESSKMLHFHHFVILYFLISFSFLECSLKDLGMIEILVHLDGTFYLISSLFRTKYTFYHLNQNTIRLYILYYSLLYYKNKVTKKYFV